MSRMGLAANCASCNEIRFDLSVDMLMDTKDRKFMTLCQARSKIEENCVPGEDKNVMFGCVISTVNSAVKSCSLSKNAHTSMLDWST